LRTTETFIPGFVRRPYIIPHTTDCKRTQVCDIKTTPVTTHFK